MSFSEVGVNRQGPGSDNGHVAAVQDVQMRDANTDTDCGLMGLLLYPLAGVAGVSRAGGETLVIEEGGAPKGGVADGVDLVPPYAPYCSWIGLLDALAANLPPVLDEAYLVSIKVSASSIKPLRSALRFMGLVGTDGLPTEMLRELVEALRSGGGHKVKALRELVYRSYSTLFFAGFDLKTVTMDELRLFFATAGARGQIQQKCSTFFLNLARDAGLDLPYNLVPPTSPAAQRRGPQAGPSMEERREWTSAFSRELGILMGIFPKFDIDWPEEKKQQWFRDFVRVLRIAERGEEPRVN